MKTMNIKILTVAILGTFLTACGGGGGSSNSAVRPDVSGAQLAMALPTAPASGAPLVTSVSEVEGTGEEEKVFTHTLSDGTKVIFDDRVDDAETGTIRRADDTLRFVTVGDEGEDEARDNANQALADRVFGSLEGSGEDDDADADYFLANAANGNVVTVADAYVDYGDEFVDFGIWLEVAAGGEIVDQLAYAIGSDPFTVANIGGLSGTATYNGGATAVYAGADGIVDIFGNVALTADFDTNMIGGAITGLRGGFGTSTEFDAELVAVTAGIVLAPADFSAGGTWTGTTTTTLAGGATGQWGGQFFGNNGAGTAEANQPQYAVGIFNGANADNDAAFIGGYIAEKQ